MYCRLQKLLYVYAQSYYPIQNDHLIVYFKFYLIRHYKVSIQNLQDKKYMNAEIIFIVIFSFFWYCAMTLPSSSSLVSIPTVRQNCEKHQHK